MHNQTTWTPKSSTVPPAGRWNICRGNRIGEGCCSSIDRHRLVRDCHVPVRAAPALAATVNITFIRGAADPDAPKSTRRAAAVQRATG